ALAGRVRDGGKDLAELRSAWRGVEMADSRARSGFARLPMLLLGLLLVAACSGGEKQVSAPASGQGQQASAPASGQGQPAAAQEPKVRRLVMAVAAPGTESNAPRLIAQTESWQIRPMYEHLVGIDPENGKYVPQLATEWGVEPDGKSFRFKLRRGVQFHGGYGEFTAKDVVFSLWDTTRDDAPGSESVLLRNVVEQVEVVNDY